MDYNQEQFFRMQMDVPKMPFYMSYPMQNLYLTEMEYEKDMERMKELYPKDVLIAAVIFAAAVCQWGGNHGKAAETVSFAALEDIAEKKVAITFDDDVIIGLSQEISYKEAVSMI